jgi:hypothetical protein
MAAMLVIISFSSDLRSPLALYLMALVKSLQLPFSVSCVICALPYHILAILFFAKTIVDCDMSLLEAQLFYLFIWSYFFSPVIYPIIYGFQDDGFSCCSCLA